MRRAGAAAIFLLVIAGAAILSIGVAAQEGILTLRVEPNVVEVAPGASASGRIVLRNESLREADDVEFAWTGAAGIALATTPQSVSVVGAFASSTVAFTLVAAPTVAIGDVRGSLEVLYTYCIDELCFQIAETVPVDVRVAATPQTPSATALGETDGSQPASPDVGAWRWWVLAVAVLLVLVAAALGRSRRIRTATALALVVAGVAVLVLGVRLDQHTQAQAVGAVLCTSCVGIETVEVQAPRLSTAQAAAVDRLSKPVELLVFYATWCRSCPYAEAMVDLVATRNPLVSYRLVNAETERELAAEHGVTRAGRTVVPAIVRVDTGEVLFGAEKLGDRLVGLIEEET